MNLFYASEISGELFTLDKEESNHLVRVLRMTENELVHFTDGKGFFYECKIVDANPKKCVVSIEKKYEGSDHRNFFLQIGIAPTKNNARFEWFLEKSTEIGIDTITPLICAHSERKEVKTERLNKVITAAVKQSIKSRHPLLEEQNTFSSFVNKDFNGQKFIAYVDKENDISLSKAYLPGNNALVLIGPEGDFSPEEIELAKKNGYIPINLGPSRLRTETAGIVACHTINLMNSLK
jgi:16S rRNA (uracil1498-N3)-methyltransferase